MRWSHLGRLGRFVMLSSTLLLLYLGFLALLFVVSTPALTIGPITLSADPDPSDAVHVTTEMAEQSGIRVTIKAPNGTPEITYNVAIYKQEGDRDDEQAKGQRITYGRTDATGSLFLPVEPGRYVVELSDYTGYLWGTEYNYYVRENRITKLEVLLGELEINIVDANGKTRSGHNTEIYLQEIDVNGNPVPTERIAQGRTGNAGRISYHLTPGQYAINIHDLPGYPWQTLPNQRLTSGNTTTFLLELGQLTVGVRDADGTALPDKQINIYLQEKDLNGDPIKGERLFNGQTDHTGAISWDVTAGAYAVEIPDVAGNPWGEELNHTITSGDTTQVILTLGKLAITFPDSPDLPAANRHIWLAYQEKDVSGNLVAGERFLEGRTDEQGTIEWNVTAGTYVLGVDDTEVLDNVEIQSGEVTVIDGVEILSGE